MARSTPEEAAAAWAQNLSASTEKIRRGIQRVTVAPGAQAARARQAWLQRLQASQDKWARNVARVSLEEWRTTMEQVGLPRVAQGAQAKQPKMQAFMNEFLPFLDSALGPVRAMPKGTLEEAIAKSGAAIRAIARFRRGGPTPPPMA